MHIPGLYMRVLSKHLNIGKAIGGYPEDNTTKNSIDCFSTLFTIFLAG